MFSFLSAGIDCYCTDKIAHPEALTASKDCRTPCTACKNTQRCNTTANGDRTELCGGGGHVAAYRFKCSGAPVPRPYPPPPPPPCAGNGDRGAKTTHSFCQILIRRNALIFDSFAKTDSGAEPDDCTDRIFHLTAGCGYLFNPCINASNPGNFTQLPFCNASLPLHDRVSVRKLTPRSFPQSSLKRFIV